MDEKVSKKNLWREKVSVSISWHERGGKKERDGENLAKCSAHISLSTKLKENLSLVIEEGVELEIEENEKLISINRWFEELNSKSECASQEKECNKSARVGLMRERSMIDEAWDVLGAIRVLTPKILIQKRSCKAKYKQRSSALDESLLMGEPHDGCWRLKSPTTKVGERGISKLISSWKHELSPAPGRQ